MIRGIIKIKTKCILAYCHSILQESEMLMQKGEGIIVIEDKKDREKVRELGFVFLKFCEDNNCTKDYLESKVAYSISNSVKAYYSEVIRIYSKYFKTNHIPLLFAIILFQRLSIDKIINLDIDLLQENIKIFLKSQKLEHKEFTSLVNREKKRIVNVEAMRYFDCVEDMLSSVKKKQKSKKRK